MTVLSLTAKAVRRVEIIRGSKAPFADSRQGFCRAKAFTLLETVIAMALLILVVTGAFALLVSSFATMRRTEETLYVNRLLESAIEMTRNLSFTDIAGDPATGVSGYAASTPVRFSTESTLLRGTNNYVLYNKGVPAADDPAAAMNLDKGYGKISFKKLNNDLYVVTASVTWTPFRRGKITQSTTTYIARGGIDKR